MQNTILPLVNWGMGTTIIVVFAIVCVVLSVVVYRLVNSGKDKENKE